MVLTKFICIQSEIIYEDNKSAPGYWLTTHFYPAIGGWCGCGGLSLQQCSSYPRYHTQEQWRLPLGSPSSLCVSASLITATFYLLSRGSRHGGERGLSACLIRFFWKRVGIIAAKLENREIDLIWRNKGRLLLLLKD